MKKAKPTPILDALLASKVIRIEKGEFVAIAKDGTEVSLGCAAIPEDFQAAERYLAAYPTPDMW
jgi:hypothetical protein